MAQNRVLEIVIRATDEASKTVADISNKLKKNVDNLQPAFKKMATIGTASFIGIAAAVGKTTQAFAKSQAQLTIADKALETLSSDALKQFGGSVEKAKKVAREFGAEMQTMGGIADEEVSIAFAKFTQITQDSEQAMKAARVAADLAKFKQIDYGTAVDVVTKVLAGNTSVLSRYGIVVAEGATATEGLAAINAVAGGQYEAFGKTIAGQTEILKQSFGDLQEELGAAFAPAIAQLVETIRPVLAQITEWVKQNPELTKNIVLAILAITGLVAAIGFLGLALPPIMAGLALLAGPVGIIAGIIVGLGITVMNVVKIFQMLHDDGKVIWEGIKIMVKEAATSIIEQFNSVMDIINRVKEGLEFITGISAAKKIVSTVSSKIKGKATGGGVQTGRTYLVGEQGPEIFTPASNGSITPNAKLAGVGGGGMNLTINMNGGTYLSPDVAEDIGDMIIQRFKQITRF